MAGEAKGTVTLVESAIDSASLVASIGDPDAGATVLFVGTTRRRTGEAVTERLEYEAHEPMAVGELGRLREAAIARFSLAGCGIVHRLGTVEVGEASVAVATAAAHRREAFAAAEWLMEEIKRTVPIWKCDESADGVRHWVHPGASKPVLVDGFGRIHTDLRVSVTDRCNLRCTYCMPLDVAFKDRSELLTFEEIERVVRVAVGHGIRSVRLTGGEPLVRKELDRLVASLSRIDGLGDVSLTTNGLLLAEQAGALAAAGLSRLNVSLDSLRQEVFEKVARARGLARVLDGLAAAKEAGFRTIRINAVSIRGFTEPEIVPLAEFCRREGFHLRFIEFMPLDAEESWSDSQVLSGADVRRILETHLGPLVPVALPDPGQPAVDYRYADGGGLVGFIDPVSRPFCDRCDRLRLTADGQFRNCLFSTTEWDARAVLRSGGGDDEIARLLFECVAAKRAAHGIGSDDFERPARAMYQIGG